MADAVFSIEIYTPHHHPLMIMETAVQQTISVNGEECSYDASLAVILRDFGIDVSQARGVAVAVNDEVVRKSDWPAFVLSPDDRVEIVTARQGG